MSARLAALLLVSLVLGCRHELPRAPGLFSTAVFNLDKDAGFFDSPFPADARLTDAGAPDFSRLPNPGGIAIAEDLVELAADRDGYDPGGAIYFRFDRPLPFSALPPQPNTLAFPGIELVDVDPDSLAHGTRYPLWVRTSARHDGLRPANLLQLLPPPGIALQPATTYAVIVDRDVDGDGALDLGRPEVLTALLSGTGSARWTRSFAPLVDAAEALGIDLDQLAAATVFTTGDPGKDMRRWVDQALQGPAPKLVGKLKRTRDFEGFVVIEGTVRLPIYQLGTPPHLWTRTGQLEVDDAGDPIVQTTVDAPFVLSIPKGPHPGDTLPLYFYVHGTGGKATQAIDRGYRTRTEGPKPGSGLAGWVAPLGYATSCLAGAYSPDRIGWRALDGYGAYNFFNPRAMRDNFTQMILEQVLFLRLLEELEIDPALVPEAEAKRPLRFAKDARVVGGQSLGSYLSGMLAGLTGSFDAAILTGAGGTWVEFGFGPKDPVDLPALLDILIAPKGERLDHHHPFITLFQTSVSPADNTNYTPLILRRPREGRRIPHVLVIQGQHDLQVPVNLQRALVLSMGADLVGPEVGATPDARITPVLGFGGLSHLPLPVQGNHATPLGARTAAVRRFMEDGIVEGHYVVFQRDDARRTLVDFVRDVRDGTVPTIR